MLPLPDDLEEFAIESGKNTYEMGLYGGEDYELLFTIKPDTTEKQIREISKKSKTPITEVGVITANKEKIVGLTADGEQIYLKPRGWDHFG